MGQKLLALVFICAALLSCGDNNSSVTVFELLIENISDQSTLTASDGSAVRIVFSPGTWAIHKGASPMYTLGQPAGDRGLEPLAEDGDPTLLTDSLRITDNVYLVGFFSRTVDDEGLLSPGQTYRILITASEGTRLSLVSSFLQSNDLFIGFRDTGLPLFGEDGAPLSGDITSEVFLYDAGTEINEEPGLGPNQPPRQPEPGTGPDENGLVHFPDDGFFYPEVSAMLRVTITPTQVVESN